MGLRREELVKGGQSIEHASRGASLDDDAFLAGGEFVAFGILHRGIKEELHLGTATQHIESSTIAEDATRIGSFVC